MEEMLDVCFSFLCGAGWQGSAAAASAALFGLPVRFRCPFSAFQGVARRVPAFREAGASPSSPRLLLYVLSLPLREPPPPFLLPIPSSQPPPGEEREKVCSRQREEEKVHGGGVRRHRGEAQANVCSHARQCAANGTVCPNCLSHFMVGRYVYVLGQEVLPHYLYKGRVERSRCFSFV